MKTRQLVIFGIFVLLSGLIYLRLTSAKKNEKPGKKDKQEIAYVPYSLVQNELRNFRLSSYGQVNPTVAVDVSFEVQGKLEYGKRPLRPGMRFSKNELLYQVNNEEAYYALSARKNQLATLIINAMPDIEIDFSSERDKWFSFLNNIKSDQLLPNFPLFKTNKERLFMTSRGITAEYYNLMSSETRMKKYLFIAPFSGTVSDIYTEPGSLAGPGVRIARIVKTGDYEVKVPISLKQLSFFESENSAQFVNANGEVIGTGRINRISDIINQQTQSLDVYYTIQPKANTTLYNGSFLTAEISRSSDEKTMTIPRSALDNNRVQLLDQNHIIERQVTVLGAIPDSVHVSGLKNGDKVILERVDPAKKQKLIGIKR